MIDPTVSAIRSSLAGLAARQRAIADNVANLETPGYQAKRVSFEESLAAAISSGDPSQAQLSQTTSSDPSNPNGNNVQLETETLDMQETSLRYQLSIEALNAKYRLLRTAIKG